MSSDIEQLLSALADEHPEDREDLAAAFEVFHKQRLTSLGRLSSLNDAQWARMGLSLGVEALIRDALGASSGLDEASVGTGSPPAAGGAVPSSPPGPGSRGSRGAGTGYGDYGPNASNTLRRRGGGGHAGVDPMKDAREASVSSSTASGSGRKRKTACGRGTAHRHAFLHTRGWCPILGSKCMKNGLSRQAAT